MAKPPIWQQQQQSSWKRNPNSKRRQTWPTKVSIHWSMKYSAYALKWNDLGHWDEMQPFFALIKSHPYGEYMYDGDEKIWYITEQIYTKVQALFDALSSANIFEVDFQKKPDNQTHQSKFVSIDTYLDKFLFLTNCDCRDSSVDFNKAKREYFKACMRLHPDKGNDPKDMTELNVAWDHIKELHYKIKKELDYVS